MQSFGVGWIGNVLWLSFSMICKMIPLSRLPKAPGCSQHSREAQRPTRCDAYSGLRKPWAWVQTELGLCSPAQMHCTLLKATVPSPFLDAVSPQEPGQAPCSLPAPGQQGQGHLCHLSYQTNLCHASSFSFCSCTTTSLQKPSLFPIVGKWIPTISAGVMYQGYLQDWEYVWAPGATA